MYLTNQNRLWLHGHIYCLHLLWSDPYKCKAALSVNGAVLAFVLCYVWWSNVSSRDATIHILGVSIYLITSSVSRYSDILHDMA